MNAATPMREGDTLAACLAAARRRAGAGPGTAPPGAALHLVRKVLVALETVHRKDVHGRVSPDVILLSRGGDVDLANGAAVRGAPLQIAYAAPEQARDEAATPETDVFATAAVLHRMLVGRAPYETARAHDTRERLVSGAPPVVPDGGSPAIRALLVRALSPRPEDRFRSAAAMLAAVDAIVASEGASSSELRAFCEANCTAEASPQARAVQDTAVDPRGPSYVPAPVAPHMIPRVPTVPPAGGEFFDVKNLAQRASSPRVPRSDGVVEGVAPPETEDGPPIELAEERPGLRAAPAAATRPYVRPLVIGAGILAVVLGVSLVLPGFLVRRIVAGAAEAGITLSIGRASVGLGTLTLTDVRASRAEGTDMRASFEDVRIEGFDARKILVRGAVLELDGPPSVVLPELETLASRLRGGKENARLVGVRHVSVPSASLAWTNAFGAGTRIAATNGSAELTVPRSSVLPIDGSAHAGRLEVTSERLHLGPWSAAFETADVTSRLSVSLDPVVPDGPRILLLGGAGGARELTVRIPRSPLERIGLRPEEVGLADSRSAELEVTLDGRAPSGGGRVEGKATLALYGAKAGKLGPLDVRLEGAATGPAGGTLTLERTSVTAGPFVAAVDGTLARQAGGGRLDASFKAQPVPCARFVRAEVKTWGPLAAALQEIMHDTGVARVTGSAQASGTVTWDLPDGRPAVEVTAKDTCGLSLFAGATPR